MLDLSYYYFYGSVFINKFQFVMEEEIQPEMTEVHSDIIL